MKKKSNIKIIKDNQNKDSYTFVMGIDQPSIHNLKVQQNNKESEENTGVTEVDNLNKIYKKKKVLTNEDVRKASKGLKFNNPSQRNHSSVYE
ncbi:MAG TPA: hypothetical protein VD815_11785 [Candidatus Saccharimonadales bacterium]|nr:hypothetical protein [Candidatus Saccharimonadales bacterium]